MAAEAGIASGLTAGEADELFAPLLPATGIAVAVSGGADSVALMHLLADWRRRAASHLPMRVLTVDHGLREGSAAEAKRVAAWAAELALAHETLRWTGPKPFSNLQAAARTARYRLLCEACARHGLSHLVTAHHLDDQAETLLLRLARGSGVDGLSAMSGSVMRGEIVHMRPLLDVPKDRLVATLREHGRTWIEDPSNGSDAFARARLRRLMPALAKEGLDARRLAATARRLSRARAALEASARHLERDVCAIDNAGFATVDLRELVRAEEEIGLRVLARVLMAVGGGTLPPRLDRLERLWAELGSASFSGATLAGCALRPSTDGLLVHREWGREGLPRMAVPANTVAMWDNRFRIANGSGEDLEIAPLGRQLPPDASGENLPPGVLAALPAACLGGRPVAAPIPRWNGVEPYGELVELRFVELDLRRRVSVW
ncbi:tRNA lysidine(34) synthetase TilS [Lutibaculum baratangense]|uniref:tRNA(Ile)-lysidine synthase n=1 Tax=Lutibaculum baratangense AMV1 TaxID=631454 RepID=V4RJ96_9HYPH|nr:tRNA lysidine(34) synthetase TilS [Lutibaculum baratangense]ESR26171.1 tRNA(Ile)-lysidine synthetase [Lutibaculum baratangense AMV1]